MGILKKAIIMTEDPTPSHAVADALQSLPFGNLIGAPLTACAEAQADQAKVAAKFMKEVGFGLDKEVEENE